MSEAPLELAERALGAADGDVQVTVTRERSLLSRFARSAPTQATEIDDVTVHVLVMRDGHLGAAVTNLVSDDALRETARRARTAAAAAAQAADAPGEHPGLPGPPPAYPGHDGFDDETAELDPGRAGAALSAAFAEAARHDLEAFGVWTAGAVETAIASSTGVRAHDAVTDAYMKVICRRADGRSGWGAAGAVASGALDAGAIAREAAARVPSGEPVELEPGEYPVVLEPDAVGPIVDFLGELAFNGLAHAEGRGALDGRLGTRVAAPSIDLVDAAAAGRTLPRAFDAEAVPKSAVGLIEGGVAKGLVHDIRSAARAGDGARSTGHATAPGGAPDGPYPTNLVLAGGTAADVDELAAPIERGLYVTRVWYVNVVHAKQTLLTGTSRDGTFLIEDGKIGRPARDVRFTDSALRILEHTEALTAESRLVCEADFYGRRFAYGIVCPALRAQGFRITGVTR